MKIRGMELVDLDKPRLLVDFNELLANDLILLAREDIKRDSAGEPVRLCAGLQVGIYSDDNLDHQDKVNPIIADGVAEPNTTGLFPHVKWCCRIDANGIRYLTDERVFVQIEAVVNSLTGINYVEMLAESRRLLTWLKNEGWNAQSVYDRLLPIHNALNEPARDFMTDLLDYISGWCAQE